MFPLCHLCLSLLLMLDTPRKHLWPTHWLAAVWHSFTWKHFLQEDFMPMIHNLALLHCADVTALFRRRLVSLRATLWVRRWVFSSLLPLRSLWHHEVHVFLSTALYCRPPPPLWHGSSVSLFHPRNLEVLQSSKVWGHWLWRNYNIDSFMSNNCTICSHYYTS